MCKKIPKKPEILMFSIFWSNTEKKISSWENISKKKRIIYLFNFAKVIALRIEIRVSIWNILIDIQTSIVSKLMMIELDRMYFTEKFLPY